MEKRLKGVCELRYPGGNRFGGLKRYLAPVAPGCFGLLGKVFFEPRYLGRYLFGELR